MIYDWGKFLSLAETLYNDPPQGLADENETLARNIISRAYYAAHNIARIKKYERDGIKLTEKKHDKVINYFTNYDNDHKTDIGDPLLYLCKRRGEADYEENKPSSLNDAHLALLQATDIIIEIKKVSTPPPAKSESS